MNEVITIGVDLAKNVFQVHGVDAECGVVVPRPVRRGTHSVIRLGSGVPQAERARRHKEATHGR
jgi:hypothetical protein